jgi:hypothetical protein
MSAFIITTVSGLLVAVLGVVIYEMMIKPKLIFFDRWKGRKWVRRYEKRKKTFSVPRLDIRSPLSPPSITIVEFETNREEIVTIDGNYFDFYGITIKNSNFPNVFAINRKTAEITRTTFLLDDGYDMECRWWSRDYAEIDKLFAGDELDITARRTEEISSGSFENLVIAYRKSESSNYYLFDITSDVKDNFWNKKYEILDFPRFAVLKIFTKSNVAEIKLELSLDNDTKNELVIKEIKAFPDLVLFRES